MKAFVVALLAFVAVAQALTDQEKAAIGNYYKECVASTSVDEALVKRLRAGEEVAEDEKLVKYVGCMFTKLNFVNAAGVLQEETIRAKIPSDFNKDEANKIITECKEVKAEGADKIAFAAYRCFLKKSTKLIEF